MIRKIFIILLLSLSLNAEIGNDKYKHMAAGAFIYYGCITMGLIAERNGYDNPLTFFTCLMPVFVIGAGKEIYDSQHSNHTSEWADLGATIIIPTANFLIIKF